MQKKEAVRAGLSLAREGEHSGDVLTCEPGVVASGEALDAFLQASEQIPGDIAGVIHDGGWSAHPAFGAPSLLFRLRGGGRVTQERLGAARRLDVTPELRRFPVPLVDIPGGRVAEIEAGRALVIRVSSWPGLLWANLLTLAPVLERELTGGWRGAARMAWASVRSGSRDPETVSLHLVRKEPGAVIEPGASVYGSWLAEGARVATGAVVRHSIVGPGAVVEAQALVVGSVLGARARVQRRGFVSYSLLEHEAVCGGTLQLSVLGSRSQLKVGALLQDQVLGSGVRVPVDGVRVEVPLGLLGCGLGAGSIIGAGVQVAAGRRIPPGVQVVAGPDQVVLRPEVPEGRYRIRDGSLEPC
jgi:carbonic anhydrase/acetyltransferase-like protein (isoleucine patch superfamily)